MKERPILFSAPMVRALLNGHKTQTRRIVKPQPLTWDWPEMKSRLTTPGILGLCKQGQPGDRLWVKETFREIYGRVAYRADVKNGIIPYHHCLPESAWRPWKPSIFMPRKTSRITLAVSNVKVERLQDISESDALDEGCPGDCEYHGHPTPKCSDWYRLLWESINGPGSWAANPWVWVITFQRIPKELDCDDTLPMSEIERIGTILNGASAL